MKKIAVVLVLITSLTNCGDILSELNNGYMPFDYFRLATSLNEDQSNSWFNDAVVKIHANDKEVFAYRLYNLPESTAIPEGGFMEFVQTPYDITVRAGGIMPRAGEIKPNDYDWKKELNYVIDIHANLQTMTVTSLTLRFKNYNETFDLTQSAGIYENAGKFSIYVDHTVVKKGKDPLKVYISISKK